MRSLFVKSKKTTSSPDLLFIVLVAVLVVFGLVMLSSASSDLGKLKFGNSYYYVEHQLLYGLVPGLIGFLIGAFMQYRIWERWSLPLFIVGIMCLVLVFTPLGFGAKGSDRWLNIGLFTFQPSELLKICFFIYLAAWMGKDRTRGRSFIAGFLPFLILLGSVTFLLFLQPATGVVFLIFTAALLMYFSGGAKIKFLVVAVLIACIGFSLIVYNTPYRLQRVLAFFNPDIDQLGKSYHINQALLAIGSGGITGVGFGKSTTKLWYLPEPIGDSIFAVIAEELGFIGAMCVVFLFFALVWRGFMIARESSDTFARLLVSGFVCLIGFQVFMNIASISNLIPLTGIPLPFISYGGTALTIFLTMCGIIVNISRYRRS